MTIFTPQENKKQAIETTIDLIMNLIKKTSNLKTFIKQKNIPLSIKILIHPKMIKIMDIFVKNKWFHIIIDNMKGKKVKFWPPPLSQKIFKTKSIFNLSRLIRSIKMPIYSLKSIALLRNKVQLMIVFKFLIKKEKQDQLLKTLNTTKFLLNIPILPLILQVKTKITFLVNMKQARKVLKTQEQKGPTL